MRTIEDPTLLDLYAKLNAVSYLQDEAAKFWIGDKNRPKVWTNYEKWKNWIRQEIYNFSKTFRRPEHIFVEDIIGSYKDSDHIDFVYNVIFNNIEYPYKSDKIKGCLLAKVELNDIVTLMSYVEANHVTMSYVEATKNKVLAEAMAKQK